MLILGGRYGSIDDRTGISYTEMEYDYALRTNKPIISIVLSNKYLNNVKNIEITKYFERKEKKYIFFKKKVKNKMVKIIDKIEDIDSSIPKAILEIGKNEDIYLTGWIRGDFSKIDNKFKIGQLSFNEVNNSLRKKEFIISEKYWDSIGEKISGLEAYFFIKRVGGSLASSYTNKDSIGQYMYDSICPFFISLGLLETKKVVGKRYYETKFTKDGIKFNQLQEKFENQ